MTTDPVVLACPQCGDTESLLTVETLAGYAGASSGFERDANRVVDMTWDGYTDVDYDSSITVGVTCKACGWEHIGGDWSAQLVTYVDDEEDDESEHGHGAHPRPPVAPSSSCCDGPTESHLSA